MSENAVAIVGAACRFPGAAGLEAFWRSLIDGVDAVSEIGSERWSTRFFYHPERGEPGKTYSWAAGLIDGVDQFEPAFFGISPREAAEMDPQQRLLLELAWHALEDAGILPSRLSGSATGVYIGASSTDYGDLRLGDPASGGSHFVSGMTLSILANRLSHVFDLRGPSLVIDTACSSSLVALHEACLALRAGAIEVALVGGVNLLLSPYPFIGFAQAGMLSRRGRCYAFDARADGYVRGEGGAVVVLKPLAQALAEGDPVRAVILATAVNASGRTIGLSQPSTAAQADLLRGVYRDAGIAADALAFIEMHGTGTPTGDPAEAEAVGLVLGQMRRKALPIGSVKTNIGHLEPASGIAGLIKTMLALEHGVLPRTLYYETPNPAIPFAQLNLRLADAAEPIGGDACAGVSSFGFGGVNAHAILGAPRREAPRVEAETGSPPPLMISARSAAALTALARSWRDTLAATSSERRPLLLRAAARRRDHHAHRLVVLGDGLAGVLDDFLAGKSNPAAVAGEAMRDGKLAFVYSGNGAQFAGMGHTAYHRNLAFRAALAEAGAALRPHLGWSVAERIARDLPDEALRRADIAQPLLFAIQVAVTEVLRGMGVAPGGFVGHSVGEIAAAWAAGALSLDDAAQVVAARSRHQERARGTGRMAVLALSATEAGALLAETGGEVEIAAINAARAVTIAGPTDAIVALGEIAARRGIALRPLDLDFAFHSAAMAPIRDGLIADLADLASTAPTGDLVSTVTGERIATGTLDAHHWWRNIRDPVRFSVAIDTLIADGYRIFVEIGPTPVLLSYMRDALKTAELAGHAQATLDRRATSGDPFPAIAARLHIAGHDMSRAPWLDGPDEPRRLPLYPWQRERFWFARTVEAAEQTNSVCDHPLLGFHQNGAGTGWLNHIDTTLFPFLADHRVDGVAVLPAAAIIDMALAATRAHHPDAAALALCDVELLRPMTLDDGMREMQSALLPDGAWQISSRKRLAAEMPFVHAIGRLDAVASERTPSRADEADPGKTITGEALYRLAAQSGLDYGPGFRTVAEIALLDDDRAEVRLRQPETMPDWLLDPRLLDGAFQGLLALLRDAAQDEAAFLPRRFDRIVAFAPFGRAPARAALRLTRRGARSAAVDIVLYDVKDEAVAELAGCWFARVDLRRTDARPYLRAELVPAPLDTAAPLIFDRLPELVPRAAAAKQRDPAREAGQAVLFEASLAAIAREARNPRLSALTQRFASEDLPESNALWRSLLADYPEMVAELALTAMLREAQPIDQSASAVAALRSGSPPVVTGRQALTAVLDEIAGAWPRERSMRIHESGASRLSDRLRRAGIAVVTVDENVPCDLALFTDAGTFDPPSVKLAPGGALLAVSPLPHAIWQLLGDWRDWRVTLAAASLRDVGAARVAEGPWPCDIVWARAPAGNASTAAAPPLSLGVVADRKDDEFAAALEAQGHQLAAPEAAEQAIVFAVGGSSDPAVEVSRLIPELTGLAVTAAERRVPLWLVTSGGQQAGGTTNLIGAALWGFGRVLRNEIPGLILRMLDLPSGMPVSECVRRLAAELAATHNESEVVWTGLGRHVMRLRRGLPSVWAKPGDAIAASARPGRLDRLEWTAVPSQTPGPGEVAIEVGAVGVNFRDVMAATGALPEHALLDGFAGEAFGLECAGVVTAIGEGVATLAVGDRVAGFAPAALASRVVTRADAVFTLPPELDFVAAATLPVAFVTARYALLMLAQLRPGETVLIHAASGGVGLAALQTAKAAGAKVIATAGSPAKRAFLQMAGADHVCDSRELRFVAAVRDATGRAGVDVVLNALAGEAMEASLELLRPFGRFVELGKRDFHKNRAFRPRPLRHNISYFAVDVDQLPLRRADLAKSLLAEVAAALTAGEIRPLAHRRFTFAETADAFRLMQAAQHIGKLVLVPDGNAGIAVARRPPKLAFRPHGAYVVTGGLSGFGYATAKWLAERGAGHLALIGRRGVATPGATERIAELQTLGAKVSVYAADVADPAPLSATLDAMRLHAPIRGVIHAAAVIVDGTAATLTAKDVATAMRAKVAGATNLDHLTRQDPLDLFWLFSSATTFVGAPGQGAYVAANAAVEALARRRHGEGRPALAIAWGPIADVGTLADHPGEGAALSRRLGARPVPAARALAVLPVLAASGQPVVALADLAPGDTGRHLPILADALFDDIRRATTEVAADEELLDRLTGLDAAERQKLLATVIADEAALVLRLPEGGVDPYRPLTELGMDSLMAIELRLALEARLRLDVPLMNLTDGASAARLAAQLAKMIVRPAARPGAIAALATRHEAPGDAFTIGVTDLAAED